MTHWFWDVHSSHLHLKTSRLNKTWPATCGADALMFHSGGGWMEVWHVGGGKREEGWFLSDPDHFRGTPVVSRSIYYHLSSFTPLPEVWCWRWAELSDSCRQEAKTTDGNAFIYGAVKREDLTRRSRFKLRNESPLKILLLCCTAQVVRQNMTAQRHGRVTRTDQNPRCSLSS